MKSLLNFKITDAGLMTGGRSHRSKLNAIASVMRVDLILVALFGSFLEVRLASAGPIANDVPPVGSSTEVSPMSVARNLHTAVLLPDGRALVAGGFFLSRAEIFDPRTASWTNTGPMTTHRYMSTATLLADGNVLVAGGLDYHGLASAELFDPATSTWTAAESMKTPHDSHTATLLPNGKVLVAGGFSGSVGKGIATAELYDPVSNTWTATAPMLSPRFNHTAILLPNGKALIAGGYHINSLSTAELYDPVTGAWTAANPMTTNRSQQSATLLASGKVLIAGGGGHGTYSSAETFDPASGAWSPVAPMNVIRVSHSATLLRDGRVLVAGGFNSNTGALSDAEIYDPATDSWATGGNLVVPRSSQTATLLPDGTVLLTGGLSTNDVTASVEVYNANPMIDPALQPEISTLTSPADPEANFMISSSNFGGGQGNPPLAQLRSLGNGQTIYLSATAWSSNSFTALPVNGLWPGWTMATLFVNGIPSQGYLFALQPLLPGPALQISASSENLNLTWTAKNPGRFHLQATADLSGTHWTTADNLVVVTNGSPRAIIPIDSNMGFYRLGF